MGFLIVVVIEDEWHFVVCAFFILEVMNCWLDKIVIVVDLELVGNYDLVSLMVIVSVCLIGIVNMAGIYMLVLCGSGNGGDLLIFGFGMKKVVG